MAGNLNDLRRAAGYRSAKDFAAAIGVPPSTYSRYESAPESIPLRQAWAIADFLGCTIDAVVGRAPAEGGAATGEVQRAYDALPPAYRRMAADYLEFVTGKAREEGARRDAAAERRYRALAGAYERLLFQRLDADGSLADAVAFGEPGAVRSMLQELVGERARAATERGVAEHLAGLEEELRQGHVAFEYDGGDAEVPTDDEIGAALSAERERLLAEFGARDEQEVERIMGAYDRMAAERGAL